MGKEVVQVQPGAVEQRVIDVVTLLEGVVRRLRVPLLLVSLVPAIPAAALFIIGAVSGSWIPVVLAAVGLLPSLWLTGRRRQLVVALHPPAAAVAELRATFNMAGVGEQLRSNLLQLRGQTTERRPRRLAGALWKGIKLGAGLYGRLSEVPRLAPFLPGRLRGLAFTAGACVVAAVALSGYAVLLLIIGSLV